MLDFESFEILSFDCYGTLIDWEARILSALATVLKHHGRSVPPADLLETFAVLEAAAEAGSYKSYREVLRQVAEGLGNRLGFEADEDERDALVASLAGWPPFPDTREALAALRTRYRLAIISNVDDDLFAGTAVSLGVPFDWVVTARQVGSYKPSPENFRAALVRFSAPREKVLHVAQSLFHDIAPARSLGLSNVWVNRRRPDLEVPDLRTFAALAGVG